MKMINALFALICIFFSSLCFGGTPQEIIPYKYTEAEMEKGGPAYEIPASSRFTTKRPAHSPEIVYYFSPPDNDVFPIAILVGGSS